MLTSLRLPAVRLPHVPAISWPSHLWPALMVVLFGLAVIGFEFVGTGSAQTLSPGATAKATPSANSGPASAAAVAAIAPPEPEPLIFKDLNAEQAKAFNATVGESVLPNPAARAFLLPRTDPVAFNRALDCLAAAVYYEAGFESVSGQQAVAQVVLNRLRHPAYPKTVCGVVFQGQERSTGCQFTFTCDGAIANTPPADRWARARAVASQALAGYVHKPVGWSTHYHADYVVPYWAPSLDKAETVGAHIFYRWKGGWGRPYAFAGRWAGLEPEIAKMAALSPAHESALGPEEALAVEAGVEALPEELQALAEPVPDAAALAAKDGTELTKAEREAAVRFRLSVKAPAPEVKAAELDDRSGRVSTDALKWALSGSGQAAEPALGRKPAERCRVVAGAPGEAEDKAPSLVKCETASAAAAPGAAGSR